MAGAVTHDFNNLLTVIDGYSAFLLAALKDPLRAHAESMPQRLDNTCFSYDLTSSNQAPPTGTPFFAQ